MTQPVLAILLLSSVFLTGCSFNGTVLESAKPIDSDYISKEYGDKKTSAVVSIQNGAQKFDYTVKLGAHSRVMVEGTKAAAEATAGYRTKLSMGILTERPAEGPYREAALQHLATVGKANCTLRADGQLSKLAYEWTYSCTTDRRT